MIPLRIAICDDLPETGSPAPLLEQAPICHGLHPVASSRNAASERPGGFDLLLMVFIWRKRLQGPENKGDGQTIPKFTTTSSEIPWRATAFLLKYEKLYGKKTSTTCCIW